jgi:hypothetical protein
LELFTRNVVFLGTKKEVLSIEPSKLAHFLRNLDDREMYDSYNVNSTLRAGVQNKTLSHEFLGRVLNMSGVERDGVFYSDKLGLYLYFSEGMLTDFQASDGLNEWAKHWKQLNPRIIDAYESEAKRYWGDNLKQVLHEVNTQANALAGIPNAMSNEFIPLHTDGRGLVNFHMLLVCHYEHEITLADYLILNHGRYEKLLNKSPDELSFYRLGRFDYLFGSDGDLIQAFER